MGTRLQQRARQSTGPGADLNAGALRHVASGADDACAQIEVEQEVLTEGLVGAKPVTRDHIAQRRQVFDRVAQWAALARRALISAAIAMAAIRLDGSATPLAAMSSAVP